MALDAAPKHQAFENRLLTTRTWYGTAVRCLRDAPFDGERGGQRKSSRRDRAGSCVVAGGGDTVAALAHAGVERISLCLDAGGAFWNGWNARVCPVSKPVFK